MIFFLLIVFEILFFTNHFGTLGSNPKKNIYFKLKKEEAWGPVDSIHMARDQNHKTSRREAHIGAKVVNKALKQI